MCLVLIALDSHPEYSLIVAANRDEFYDRPTAPAAFWADAPSVLAGRDLKAGGTWLGIDRRGRLAAVTNYRQGERESPAPRSRGRLVSDFLTGDTSALEHLDRNRPSDGLLPSTGVGREWEHLLSLAFIASDDYGTRSSTVVLVGRDGRVVSWSEVSVLEARPAQRRASRWSVRR